MQLHNSDFTIKESGDLKILAYGAGRVEDCLKPGHTVEAKVIFASGESVNIRLSNGAVLHARLADGVRLSEGDNVMLTVKENEGESLVLQLVRVPAEAGKQSELLFQTISQLGIPENETNLKILASLVNSGLSVDQSIMDSARKILEKNPGISPDSAVFASAYDIEPDAIRLADSIIKKDFKVTDIITRIFSLLSKNPVMSLIRPEESANKPVEDGFSLNAPSNRDMESAPAPKSESLYVSDPYGEARQEVLRGNEALGASYIPAGENANPVSDEMGVSLIRGTETNPAAASDIAPENGSESGAGRFLKDLEESFYFSSDKQVTSLKNAETHIKNRLDLLKTLVKSADGDMQKRAEIYKSSETEIKRLEDGLKLFSEINSYSYLQVPVKIGGRKSTAELYVFKRKSGAKKNELAAKTVLLGLDTENLGHIEAVITVKRTGVSLIIRACRDDIADYLRERIVALYNLFSSDVNRLSNVRFETYDEPLNPLSAPETAKKADGPDVERIDFFI